MTVTLAELREDIAFKRKELHDVWEQAGAEQDWSRVTLLGQGTDEQKTAEYRRKNAVIDELCRKEEGMALVEQMGIQNEREMKRLNEPATGIIHPGGAGVDRPFGPRDLRKSLLDNRELKRFQTESASRGNVQIDLKGIDFKTLITLSTVNRQAERLSPVMMGTEERTVADLMLQSNITGNTVDYYEETTVTNNADAISGPTTDTGTAAPESALAWTLRTKYVSTIAHFIPATRDSIADVDFLEGQIRGRLAYGVIRREEALILNGDGVAPNLLGVLNSGVQTQAKGSDPVPDAIYKGMQKVRGAAGSGFAEPTAVVMHPNDWTDIRLLRTSDGVYIWGNPSDEGPDRIWGLPVRQTTEMTENTALVGAFKPHAEVMRREGITVMLSTEHSTYFTERKVAILGEARLTLAIYRPSAFVTVTGI